MYKILLVGGVSFICYISRAFAVFSFFRFFCSGWIYLLYDSSCLFRRNLMMLLDMVVPASHFYIVS